MPNDKFIFVNAPAIVNAGSKDAQHELRSQLMRRIYSKKRQVTPPRFKEEVCDASAAQGKHATNPGSSNSEMSSNGRSASLSLDDMHNTPRDRSLIALSCAIQQVDIKQELTQHGALRRVSQQEQPNVRRQKTMRLNSRLVHGNSKKIVGDPATDHRCFVF